MAAPKIIAQIVITGASIFGKAFVDAYKVAAANAARQRASSGEVGADAGVDGNPISPSDALNKKLGITLDEAALILNVKKEPIPTQQEILDRYQTLKVFRAKERLEGELKVALGEQEATGAQNAAASQQPPSQQQQQPPKP
ncbi:hypothetical protein BCR44DRAFT_1435214 [Catenaria anguillulae PL171]|uniref:Presequence translocated-associated motor subunit PAM16 n=1 Tax=Catenaria anguillulae PL171 TaxID=765915 RepID=A0A1Y2HKS2_9FUNG|nr:hypothetical protein BCR44DRAFT_1435214 [Catenaria anguillulae PL171]